MSTDLLVVVVPLAVAFATAGTLKVTGEPGDDPWWAPWSDVALAQPNRRRLGVAELAGACGVLLPVLSNLAIGLVPVAALGLGVVGVGAVREHLARDQRSQALVAVAITVLAAVACWLSIVRVGG